MLLHIIAVGRIGKSPEAELVQRYKARMINPMKITELAEGKVVPEAVNTPVRTVVMDERGVAVSSESLAARLGKWRDDGVREVRFLIGGADGHDDITRSKADLLMSFGPATWPHMLTRAMLAEQIYRAETILRGHPYHRSG